MTGRPRTPYERLAVQLERERGGSNDRARVPEPMAVYDPESVAAFDAGADGHLLPIYRFNALMLSRLLPEQGVLLDLGCGSGRLLALVAEARPDVHLVGIDISANMIRVGRTMLQARSLDRRVELLLGDMMTVTRTLNRSSRIDVISSIWSLHHLPTREATVQVLREIAYLRDEYDCAVWMFDFARLRYADTMVAVVDMSRDVSPTLRADALNSEQAAWNADELRVMLAESGLSDARGGRDRTTGHLQVWWSAPERYTTTAHSSHWNPVELPPRLHVVARRLEHDLPDLPPGPP